MGKWPSKPALHRSRGFTRAALLISLFVHLQVYSLIHLAAVDHAVCPHGEIVDCHAPCEQHEGEADHSHDNHLGCEVLSLLTVAQTTPSDLEPIEIPDIRPQIKWDNPFGKQFIIAQLGRYELAPSQSPPQS